MLFFVFLSIVFTFAVDEIFNRGCDSTDPSISCFRPECDVKLDDAFVNGSNSKKFRAAAEKCLKKKLSKCDGPKYDLAQPSTAVSRRRMDLRTFTCYIIEYIKRYYDPCPPVATLEVLIQIVYIRFNGDVNRATIFLAHCIHNTSGFKYLRGHGSKRGNYNVSRGILQIQGMEHYIQADTGFDEYFVKDPERMASLDQRAVMGSLNVYFAVVTGKSQYGFCDAWFALKPSEVMRENYRLPYYQTVILNRLRIYLSLCATLKIRPYIGADAYFLKKYTIHLQVYWAIRFRCTFKCGEYAPVLPRSSSCGAGFVSSCGFRSGSGYDSGCGSGSGSGVEICGVIGCIKCTSSRRRSYSSTPCLY